MAEGKLTTRSGEVFVFSDETSPTRPSVSMKDVIASVKKLQADVNNKLTEIINKEKGGTDNNGVTQESDEGDAFEDDSEEDEDKDDVKPPTKKSKLNDEKEETE